MRTYFCENCGKPLTFIPMFEKIGGTVESGLMIPRYEFRQLNTNSISYFASAQTRSKAVSLTTLYYRSPTLEEKIKVLEEKLKEKA